jgi:EmrB/QacA subfamily drug resistance transporter
MKKNSARWLILTAMCLLTVMLNIDATAINIAVPVIADEFFASLANMQWVINAYVLLSAMFQILGGRLGDTYGHRKLFLIGTALFVISSAGAGFSTGEGMLIAFRTLQGLSLGLAYPMTIVLTFAAFSKKQQGFALSFIVATMGVSLAIGPTLGGLLVDYIGWRWIFYINLPFGVLAYYLAWRFCAPHRAAVRHKIDYVGATFLILGLLATTLALNQVQEWGFGSPLFWGTLIVGLFFLLQLFLSEKRASFPIVDFRLFKIRNFLLNNIVRLIVQLVFIPTLFFVPLYLQNICGYSAVYSGLVMLFLTLVIGFLSPIAGKWVDSVGDRLPNIVSMIFFALGCFLFVLLGEKPDLFVLGFALLLVGMGTGISFVSTVTGSLSVASEKQQGMATGIIFTTAWLGCALGVALMGSLLVTSSLSHLHRWLPRLGETLSTYQLEMVERVAKGISPRTELSQVFSGELLEKLSSLSVDSFMHGFRFSMLIWMFLSILGVLLALKIKKQRIKPHPEAGNVL